MAMYLKSTNIAVKISRSTKILVDVICESILYNYQVNLMEKMKIIYFVFDFIDRLYYG